MLSCFDALFHAGKLIDSTWVAAGQSGQLVHAVKTRLKLPALPGSRPTFPSTSAGQQGLLGLTWTLMLPSRFPCQHPLKHMPWPTSPARPIWVMRRHVSTSIACCCSLAQAAAAHDACLKGLGCIATSQCVRSPPSGSCGRRHYCMLDMMHGEQTLVMPSMVNHQHLQNTQVILTCKS